MRKTTSNNLTGIWCSIQIPFLPDHSINYSAFQEELDYLTDTSVQGIYSNGTAAEFYNQTEAEFDRITELLATVCHHKNRPFQIGASHMSPIISWERIKRTKSLQPDAYQVILPDWLKPNLDEISAFLERMIEIADPIPLVLYNSGHSKTLFLPKDFKWLSENYPQILGVKTGVGNMNWYTEMKNLNADLAIFVPGHKLATGIKEGVAQGSYSNMACLNPDATQKWYKAILSDLPKGLEMEKRIQSFFDQNILPLSRAGYSDAALDKLLWSLRGRPNTGTRLRWPYKGVGSHFLPGIREAGQRLIPEFFE